MSSIGKHLVEIRHEYKGASVMTFTDTLTVYQRKNKTLYTMGRTAQGKRTRLHVFKDSHTGKYYCPIEAHSNPFEKRTPTVDELAAEAEAYKKCEALIKAFQEITI